MLAGWVVLLITLTSIPNPSFDVSIPYSDKVAHFGFYGVAGFFCTLWRLEAGRSRRRAVAFAMLFVALLGAADEVHQQWIPGRSMEFLDWIADFAGGTAGSLLAMAAPSRFPFLLSREIQSSPRAFTE
jgi:VanZ family protein